MILRILVPALILGPLGASSSKAVIKLGSCTGGNAGTVYFLAKVAHDLGFFDDILPSNASSAAFTFSLTPVVDGCNGTQIMTVALPLMLGVGLNEGRIHSSSRNSDPVVGIAGCTCSTSTMPMSYLANNFEVPMVSGAATNPDLSNKGLFPYFARTVPPDNLQGAAIAAIVLYYKWKRLLAAYLGEAYSQGVAGAVKATLTTATAAVTYIEYPLPYQHLGYPSDAATFDHQAWKLIVDQVAKESPQPRIFFTAGALQIDHVLRLFRDAGLISNQTLWMMPEGDCRVERMLTIAQSQALYQAAARPNDTWYDYDWGSLPMAMRGMICFTPASFGPKSNSAKFLSLYANMTRSKYEDAGWQSDRYTWDDQWLDFKAFTDDFYNPLYFDALSMFIYAIGQMVSRGVAPADIRGPALRDELSRAHFEGLSGMIGLNANGDRLAPYNVWNMLVANNTPSLANIGVYDSISGAVEWTAMPIFADGTTNPPLDRPPACDPGTEFGDAFTGCVPCLPGKASIFFDATCVNCSAGYFQSSAHSSACTPAPRGAVVAGRGATNATSCPKGSYAGDRAVTECTICAPGTFAGAAGLSACRLAPPGRYVSTAGAAESRACAAGHFSAVEGAQECTSCSGGFFQDALGQSMCNRCEHGSYAPPAASSCASCPAGMVTESAASAQVADCQCPLGQFCAGTYPECDCRACPEGMSCPWGAKEQDMRPYSRAGVTLLVKAHYYTKADDPLSVYFCHPSLGSGRCVGGPPETCSDLFQGLTCATCPSGYAPKGDRCEMCSTGNHFVFAITPIIGLICCIVTYYKGNKRVETNASITLGFSVVIGLLVTVAQLLATFSQLTMPWPVDISNFFQGMRFLVVDPNVISSRCLGDSVERQYSFRFILPYCVVAAVGCCYVSAKVLEKLRLLTSPALCWEAPKAINTVFQIYQAIFIALTAIAVVPYQCYSHPNGKSSVIQYPQVLCDSPTHGALVGMSVVLFATFIIPFIGVMVWANLYAMRIRADVMRSERHLMMFRFLLYRFRPDVWWWGTPFTVRQLLLAFAPMVRPDDPHSQCVFIIAVLVLYIPTMCFFWPWKSDELNLLDSVSMAFIAILVAAGTAFMPASQFEAGHIALMKVVLIIFGIFGSMQMVYVAYVVFSKGRVDIAGMFALNEQLLKRKETILNLILDLYALVETLRTVPSQDLVEGLLLMNSYDLSAVQRSIAVFRAASLPIVGGSGELPRRLLGVPSCCSAGPEKERTRSRSGELAVEAIKLGESNAKATPGAGQFVTVDNTLEHHVEVRSQTSAASRDVASPREPAWGAQGPEGCGLVVML